jgi:hypothetical protein
MTPTAKALLIVLSLAVVLWAWMYRLDATSPSTGIVHVTDRWTGRVYVCADVEQCRRLY